MSLVTTRSPLRASKKRVAPWYIHTSYTHSHVGVVRALCVDERNGLILTGGEDAKLNVWKDVNALSSSLYEEEEEEESDEDDGEGGESEGMDVDGEEGRREGGRGRKRGVSVSDDEMDGRKRRR